ncbi:MAG: DUF3136 domain-containing protein [Synechococcus sp. ELA057]|jgi:hypothetical protein
MASDPTTSPAKEGARSEPVTPDQPERSSLTIGELEAGYSLYCKALRLLIQEGRSLGRIQRTVCWQRLAQLHTCLPGQYRDPEHLYFLLRRQVGAAPSTSG